MFLRRLTLKVTGWLEAGEARCKPVPVDRHVSHVSLLHTLNNAASWRQRAPFVPWAYNRRQGIPSHIWRRPFAFGVQPGKLCKR